MNVSSEDLEHRLARLERYVTFVMAKLRIDPAQLDEDAGGPGTGTNVDPRVAF